MEQMIKIPLFPYFKNICMETQNYTNNITSIIIQLKDTIYIPGLCCTVFKIQDDTLKDIKYICECKSLHILRLLKPFKLYMPIVSIDRILQQQYRDEYEKNGLLDQRKRKINRDIDKMNDFINKININIAPNLNEKSQYKSHFVDIYTKINNDRQKSLFLYELECDENKKNKFKTILEQEFNKTLVSNEQIFTHLTLYNAKNVINTYINYLKISLDNINSDLFNLHPSCMFNDTIDNVLEETPNINYNYNPPKHRDVSKQIFYVIKDYNINAIIMETNCASNAYVLWIGHKSGSDEKWNIFPYNNDIDKLSVDKMQYIKGLSKYWESKYNQN